MQVPGGMALISLPVCLFFGEYYAILPFLLTAFISIGIGQLLYRLFRNAKVAYFRQSLLIVAMSWLIIVLIGAIPHWAIASYLTRFSQAPETI